MADLGLKVELELDKTSLNKFENQLKKSISNIKPNIPDVDIGINISSGIKKVGEVLNRSISSISTAISSSMKQLLSVSSAILILISLITSGNLLLKSIQALINVLKILFMPVSDVIGGIFLTFLKMLLPLVRILYQMWLPHQIRIAQKASSTEGMGGISVLGDLITEFTTFLGELGLAALGEVAKLFISVIQGIVEVITVIILGIASALNLINSEDAAKIVGNVRLFFEQMKLSVDEFTNTGINSMEAFLFLTSSNINDRTTEIFNVFDTFLINLASAFNKDFGLELASVLAGVNLAVLTTKEVLTGREGLTVSLQRTILELNNNKLALNTYNEALNKLTNEAINNANRIKSALSSISEERESSKKGSSLLTGIAAGAITMGIAGSIVPGVGTVAGIVAGSVVGAVASVINDSIKGSRASGGYINETGLYKLHSGEMVVPANQTSSSNNITINVNNPVVRDDRDIKKIVDETINELLRTGLYSRNRYSVV